MATTRLRIGPQLQQSVTPSSILYTDSTNSAAYFAPSPSSDKILFYDDSANSIAWLNLGSNLSISGTTISAASGYLTMQEEGTSLPARSILNFVGNGLNVTDDGANKTVVQLNSTLNALSSYNSTGLITQTAANTFVGRSIGGTVNKIDVTNGNGVGGDPSITISPTYVGQSSITTLGTVTTGT